MKDSNVQGLIEKVANKMTTISGGAVNEVCPIGIIDINNWEWAQGVGLYGLFKYYKASGKKEYFDFIKNWFDKRIEEGLPARNINTTAPLLTLLCVYEETKEERYMDLCRDWAEWVMNDMDRTDMGGFEHNGTGEINRQCLWDDTLFMVVLFLAKIGVMLKNQSYIDESLRQILLHIQFLCDKKTGLWYHGWTFEGKHNFADAFWGRGNCWITVVIPEYIEITGLSGCMRDYLVDVLKMQIDSLVKYQDESGLWRTLIDVPESYLETSATSGFGYGILKAVRLGLIDEKYKSCGQKALDAVIGQIDDEGTVLGVSYGTGMGRDLQHYIDIPICPMTYGQALAIMILTESR